MFRRIYEERLGTHEEKIPKGERAAGAVQTEKSRGLIKRCFRRVWPSEACEK